MKRRAAGRQAPERRVISGGPPTQTEAVDQLKALVQAGAMGAGVLSVDDCRKTYAELKAKGVQFMGEPQQRPYGIEAMLKDPFGNWSGMTHCAAPRDSGPL